VLGVRPHPPARRDFEDEDEGGKEQREWLGPNTQNLIPNT